MNDESTSETQGEVTPLQAWKNAPTVLQLKEDYSSAKLIHDTQVTLVDGYLENLNITGKAKIKPVKGASSIQPKLIRKQAEWRYASLSEPFLSTADLFNVKPKTWEDRESAQQNQLLLNHQFNTAIQKTRFIDEYVRAAVDEGTVIVRVGWEFEEEEVEVEVDDVEFRVDPSQAALHEELAALKANSPSQYATDVPDELKEAHELTISEGQPINPVVIGKKKVKQMKTVKNHPTAEVSDYRNVVFDPTCKGDVTKASFAVESFETSMAALEKAGRYKNLNRINVEGASILSQPDHAPAGGAHNFNFKDKPRKKMVAHKYFGLWDIEKDGKLVPIVATWVGDEMIELDLSPFPDKSPPFVVEQYLPVRGEMYGEPDGALLVDNQKVIGAVTRGMIDIMGKSANAQTGVAKGMLDATNRKKFEDGRDYEFNPGTDPRLGIHMHTYPEIPNSAQLMVQYQTYEAESLTGVKSFSDGISGKGLGDVAAGVRGALDAASKRELGILRRLSSGICKIGRKFMSMNAEFLSDEEVVRVTNEQFTAVRRDDLAGNFDLELSISTAEEDNNKAEQLAFLFQTIGPNGDPGMTKMILADIARLRKMPDMAKKIEDYEPQPDPVQQKMQQLELAKLEAEIQEIQAKAMSLQAGAQLDTAKVGTEGVKAANLQSDTDQKNLDFVEQESGVKQERDKELHGEQARSQGQLKLLEQDLERENRDVNNRHELLKEYVKARVKK